jgi:CBS domain-containing membrane protein
MSTSTRTRCTSVGDLLVHELMTAHPAVVSAEEPITAAWETMRRHDVHHVPVVDASRRYLGMIDARSLAADWPGGGPQQTQRPASAMLTGRRYPRIRPGDPVDAAALAMLYAGTDAVAVTGDDAMLLGIVTAHDFVTAIARNATVTEPRHPGASRLAPD